jgi:acetyl esterase
MPAAIRYAGGMSTRVVRFAARAALGAGRRLTLEPPPRNDRGEALDAHTFALIRAAAMTPALASRPTGTARLESDAYTRLLDVPFVALPRVTERNIDGPHGTISVRLYVPHERTRGLPMLVYFHGGGFVIGSLHSHDHVVRRIAKHAGVIVLAVDYRLGPEHRFPAAVDDCLAATRWAFANAESLGADPARVAVGGDSAGGNLAAVVALALRDAWRIDPRAPMPRMQLLVYPATDLRRTTASHRTLGEGYLLTRDLIAWFMDRYLNGKHDELDPRGSPLLAADHRDLPPAWMTVAGFDPLRDEGEAYAAKLREAGVHVDLVYERSLIHGFFTMGGVVPRAAEVVDAAARALAAGLATRAGGQSEQKG